jgi:hypothetical protein
MAIKTNPTKGYHKYGFNLGLLLRMTGKPAAIKNHIINFIVAQIGHPPLCEIPSLARSPIPPIKVRRLKIPENIDSFLFFSGSEICNEIRARKKMMEKR